MQYLYIINTLNFEKIHYALCMATSGAALNKKITLFFAGKSIEIFLKKNKFTNLQGNDQKTAEEINKDFSLNKIASIDGLIKASIELNIKFYFCSMNENNLKESDLMENIYIKKTNLSEIYSDKYQHAKIIYV